MISLKLDTFLPGRHPAEQTATPRTAATISAELDAAKAAVDTLASKIATAQEELNHARAEYDASVGRYALGGGREPDHTPVEKEISKLEALRRVLRDHQATMARLSTELVAAQRAESATNDEATTDALIADAESKLETWKRLAAEKKEAEQALFNALFRSPLKGDYVSEIGSRARAARFAIRDQAIAAAKEIGCDISPDFESDGNFNTHARAWDAHTLDMHRDAKRISQSIPYDPADVGERIVEEPIER
jgi:glycerol-3-phosphate O-acyltransferase